MVASDLSTRLASLATSSNCPSADTCNSSGTWCPKCSWTTNSVMSGPCTSMSRCGASNSPEVDWQHSAPGSTAFQNRAGNNVSPNIVQQIVQPVHSSHLTYTTTNIRSTAVNITFSHHSCLTIIRTLEYPNHVLRDSMLCQRKP